MKRKFQEEEDNISMYLKVNRAPVLASVLGNKYEFYLSGELLESDVYLEWFNVIRNASANDLIVIYINSPGGDANTAVQFLSVLDDCDAQILMQVEGMCASAATMLFMKAHGFAIAPHSQFLFHNYSGGAVGKGGEIKEQVDHQTKWAENLLRETYKYFFNEKEINQMLDGKDFWMDRDEVVKRMDYRLEQFKKEFEKLEKEQEDPLKEGNEKHENKKKTTKPKVVPPAQKPKSKDKTMKNVKKTKPAITKKKAGKK